MAKQVQVVVSCDNGCKLKGATKEFEVLNGKGKLVILDLHQECHDDIFGRGIELADRVGQKPGEDAKAAPKVPAGYKTRICLLCPETRASDGSMLDHIEQEHGLERSLVTFYGTECPLDGLEYPRVAQHIAQSHKDMKFPHFSHAFVYAQEHGDEFKVVAKQTEVLKRLAKAS